MILHLYCTLYTNGRPAGRRGGGTWWPCPGSSPHRPPCGPARASAHRAQASQTRHEERLLGEEVILWGSTTARPRKDSTTWPRLSGTARVGEAGSDLGREAVGSLGQEAFQVIGPVASSLRSESSYWLMFSSCLYRSRMAARQPLGSLRGSCSEFG